MHSEYTVPASRELFTDYQGITRRVQTLSVQHVFTQRRKDWEKIVRVKVNTQQLLRSVVDIEIKNIQKTKKTAQFLIFFGRFLKHLTPSRINKQLGILSGRAAWGRIRSIQKKLCALRRK